VSLRKFLSTGLGTGYAPFASGTWGSLGPAILFLVAAQAGASVGALAGAMGAIALAASVGCVAWGGWAEKEFATKDPGQVTLDEWAGQAVALLLLPVAGGHGAWLPCLLGFLAFRFFDIVKPPPARNMEALPGGWGILTDDLIAGVYANVVCQVLLRLLLGYHP
jgi:phosphatidylglycerophosphatase A